MYMWLVLLLMLYPIVKLMQETFKVSKTGKACTTLKIRVSQHCPTLTSVCVYYLGQQLALSPTCTFIPPVTPLLLPLTDFLVDGDGVVVGVASVLGPVHLPPVHLELDPGFCLLLPSCLQVTPYLQWLLIPDVIILGILFILLEHNLGC